MARARVLRQAVVPVRDVATGVPSFLVSARARVLVVRVWPRAVVAGGRDGRGHPVSVGCPRAPYRGLLLGGGGGRLVPALVPTEPGYHLTAPAHDKHTHLSGDTPRLRVEGDPLTVR